MPSQRRVTGSLWIHHHWDRREGMGRGRRIDVLLLLKNDCEDHWIAVIDPYLAGHHNSDSPGSKLGCESVKDKHEGFRTTQPKQVCLTTIVSIPVRLVCVGEHRNDSTQWKNGRVARHDQIPGFTKASDLMFHSFINRTATSPKWSLLFFRRQTNTYRIRSSLPRRANAYKSRQMGGHDEPPLSLRSHRSVIPLDPFDP